MPFTSLLEIILMLQKRETGNEVFILFLRFTKKNAVTFFSIDKNVELSRPALHLPIKKG